MKNEREIKKLATAIREIRYKLSLTQPDFAKLCGVSATTIWNYENCKNPFPNLRTLMKIKKCAAKNGMEFKIEEILL